MTLLRLLCLLGWHTYIPVVDVNTCEVIGAACERCGRKSPCLSSLAGRVSGKGDAQGDAGLEGKRVEFDVVDLNDARQMRELRVNPLKVEEFKKEGWGAFVQGAHDTIYFFGKDFPKHRSEYVSSHELVHIAVASVAGERASYQLDYLKTIPYSRDFKEGTYRPIQRRGG